MANSSIVTETKNKLLSMFQNDDDIVAALNIHEDEDAEDLIGKRLFPYWFIPTTQEEVKTYILVEVAINTERNRYSGSDRIFYDHPTITVYVLSHQDDMIMSEAGISAVRTDYIAERIDNLLNGYRGLGIGKLQRLSNIPYSLNKTYRYREIKFDTVDVNNNICEE